MIRKNTCRRWMRRGIGLLLTGAMLVCQPVPVEAVRGISEIQQEQEKIQEELDSLDSELVEIVSQMAELEAEIESMNAEIADTEQKLQEAQAAVDQQYASMKIRIQFMYENSDENILTILLESGSISDFLNRLEYVNAVYSYDRNVLDNYEAAKNEVADLKVVLEQERASLVASEADLESRQAELDAAIASKEGEMDDIKSELAEAKALAARQAELERAAANNPSSGGGANTSSGSSSGVNGDLNPPGTTGISGSDVVAYANQFVGYPYTWGGTDPTNGGADCSGFVYYVYKHFGINYGRLTSYGWRSVGQEVSYNNMQPGDIVCYAGHVGIYAGGGRIVEAQSTAAGITNTRSVNCHPIITIRRII